MKVTRNVTFIKRIRPPGAFLALERTDRSLAPGAYYESGTPPRRPVADIWR